MAWVYLLTIFTSSSVYRGYRTLYIYIYVLKPNVLSMHNDIIHLISATGLHPGRPGFSLHIMYIKHC